MVRRKLSDHIFLKAPSAPTGQKLKFSIGLQKRNGTITGFGNKHVLSFSRASAPEHGPQNWPEVRVLSGVDQRINTAAHEQDHSAVELVTVALGDHHKRQGSEAHQESQHDHKEVLGDLQLVVFPVPQPTHTPGLSKRSSSGACLGVGVVHVKL